jgi:hypothetical protein
VLLIALLALAASACGGAAASRNAVSQAAVSPTGSDSNPCTASAPCLTFDRAYHVVASGGVVQVTDGTYPAQTVTPDAKKSVQPVVFAPAAGAHPTIDSIYSTASRVEYRDLSLTGPWQVENTNRNAPGADAVTFRNVTASGFYITGGVSHVSVLGGSYGPAVDKQPQIKPYNLDDPTGPSNILVDSVTFHDFTRSNAGVHTECLQAYGAHNLTIRRSRFAHCDGTAGLGIGSIGVWGIQDALVENNWFDSTGDSYYAIQSSMASRNLVFRYNSAGKGIYINPCDGCAGPVSVIANYGPYATCTTGVIYRYNLWLGGTCGPTDINVPALDFVDIQRFDLHAPPTSPVICRGDPTAGPQTDIDGQPRPVGLRWDAGADQVSISTPQRKAIRRCILPKKKK